MVFILLLQETFVLDKVCGVQYQVDFECVKNSFEQVLHGWISKYIMHETERLGGNFLQDFISSRDCMTCKKYRNKAEMKTCMKTTLHVYMLRNDDGKE